MAFTAIGADVQLARNSANGKFDIQWDTTTNNPVVADDQSHAVLSLIYEHKGEYAGDEYGGDRGSYLWTLKELKRGTPSKARAFIEDALQPLIDSGKIKNLNVVVSTDSLNRNRLNTAINYSTSGGLTIKLRPNLGY